MTAYYNEIDPFCAQWLRNLIAAKHIAAGDVDERSIVNVRSDDLRSYRQCHFFAGIGGWSHALRLAGWPDERPVWTGSCPCQPFSVAGKGTGGKDERHLWPHWFRLIRECRSATIFGEQVAAAIRWGWLDAVCSDLEAAGYATGATVLGAHSVGAPHIRQRLWFVGVADRAGSQSRGEAAAANGYGSAAVAAGCNGIVANAVQSTSEWRTGSVLGTQASGSIARLVNGCSADGFTNGGEARDLANNIGRRLSDGGIGQDGLASIPSDQGTPPQRPRHSPWSDLKWLSYTDGKARPTQPGLFPLAHGVSGRVGRLRAYGNAIVPQVAAEFIAACAARGARHAALNSTRSR